MIWEVNYAWKLNEWSKSEKFIVIAVAMLRMSAEVLGIPLYWKTTTSCTGKNLPWISFIWRSQIEIPHWWKFLDFDRSISLIDFSHNECEITPIFMHSYVLTFNVSQLSTGWSSRMIRKQHSPITVCGSQWVSWFRSRTPTSFACMWSCTSWSSCCL